MANPLSLNAAELDVIRELQAGAHDTAAGDPIWEELADVGLIDLTAPRPQLTLRGWGYRTD
jgi:hypothetical protein